MLEVNDGRLMLDVGWRRRWCACVLDGLGRRRKGGHDRLGRAGYFKDLGAALLDDVAGAGAGGEDFLVA